DDKRRWTHYGALATVAVTAVVQLAVWEQGSTSSRRHSRKSGNLEI
ncbi:hypothetical protein HND71_08650, partial [Neisseria meningitidis]|nr:hypothetical protein [Neisseria meningitidis]